ncbi:hypothetical protein HDU89_006493 [Geranomyces variabilis]|nr:hypothetical protein HDU89_006493 [Geranomyces variabilis]
MLETTVGSVNARAPFTFNFPPGNKPDQVISSFPTTFDSVLSTSVLTTAFGDLTFSASSAQPASTGGAARAKKSRSRNGARSHKPTLSKAVSKPKISLIEVDPRPQPALPVELVDKILGYICITDQFRVAVALRDLPRRDRLVPFVFPHAVHPMDAATEAGDIDQLDAWLSRHLTSVAASQGQILCTWYSSAMISLAMLAKDPRAVLRWWARSKLPLDKCIAAVMAATPSVQQLELVKACLPAPSKETLRDIMDMPSKCGNTSTLEWLKTSGWATGWASAAMPFAFPHTVYPMDAATAAGDVDQLDTWLSRHLQNVAASQGQLSCTWYSSAMISLAMLAKNPSAVLRWWARSKLPLDKCIAAVMAATPSVQQLELVKACLPAPNKETLRDIMDMPSKCGHTSTLEWLKTSGWAIGWTSAAVDCAKSIDAVKWWINSGLEVKYTEKLLDSASKNGNIEMLEIWRTSGLTPRYSTEAMDYPKNSQVLEWWKSSAHEKSGWELRYTELSMDLFSDLYLFSDFCSRT